MKGSFTLWCKVEALFEVGGTLEELKVTSEGSNSLIYQCFVYVGPTNLAKKRRQGATSIKKAGTSEANT